MKDVDGLTLLDECVDFNIRGYEKGAGNWKKKALEEHVGKIKVRPCAPHMLRLVHLQPVALNAQVAGGLKALLSIFDPNKTGYIKALLLSCVLLLKILITSIYSTEIALTLSHAQVRN